MHVQTCTQNQWAITCAYLFHPIFGGCDKQQQILVPHLSPGCQNSAFGISRIPSKVLQLQRDERHLSSRAARHRVGSRADRKVSSEQGTSHDLLLPLSGIQTAQILVGKVSVPLPCALQNYPGAFIFEGESDRMVMFCCQQQLLTRGRVWRLHRGSALIF